MKVAILVRVSSSPDRQDHDRQISDLTALAQKNKRETVKVITARVSATKTRLPLREVYEYLTGRGMSIYMQSLGLDTGGRGAFQKASTTSSSPSLPRLRSWKRCGSPNG